MLRDIRNPATRDAYVLEDTVVEPFQFGHRAPLPMPLARLGRQEGIQVRKPGPDANPHLIEQKGVGHAGVLQNRGAHIHLSLWLGLRSCAWRDKWRRFAPTASIDRLMGPVRGQYPSKARSGVLQD